MSTAEQNKLKLAYEGSVKRVWQCPTKEDSLLFGFTDDYSIFDWGKMPETIENKGRALAIFGAYFFEHLSKPAVWNDLSSSDALKQLNPAFLEHLFSSEVLKALKKDGLASHFEGLVNESGERLSLDKAAAANHPIYMKVKKAAVQRPTPELVLGQNVFHYPAVDHSLKTRLIPLEVVFRFGMPQGSSLKDRILRDPSYAGVLGLSKLPQENEFFDRPVIEFYTKLEPRDRLLSLQEAFLISGLSTEQMNDLVERAQLTALALFVTFQNRGIELWDGKFEFILHDGKVLLADSIGPDELRLLYKGTHLSKEMIRQVYRGSRWERTLKEAQRLAKERCVLDWKDICINELKASPEPFSSAVKAVVDRLYGTLTNQVSQESLFKAHPDLDEFVASARSACLDERRGSPPQVVPTKE